MTTATLPDKPSELIRVALDDLAKCEADPTYEIAMVRWHEPLFGKCCVCLAGSVMAQTFRRAPFEDLVGEVQEGFSDSECVKLDALNSFREGSIGDALDSLGMWDDSFEDTDLETRCITRYEDDPAQFRLDMLQLATDLAAHGL